MTIEIADRLIKLRKQYGYSQEELADKLGLSRQAVSKWERAEASPDTDNLICLAKLYGISLDELLSTDEDIDTIVKEQVKKEEDTKEEKVHIIDDEGNEVIVKDKCVECRDKDGNLVKCKDFHNKDKFLGVLGIVEGSLMIASLITYILLGSLLHMWHNAWVVVFVPEIICSFVRAIYKKNANQFNMAFAAVFTFFFVCMVFPGLDANLWHPMWVVFLAIPLYYTSVSAINKMIGKEDEKDDDKDEDID